MIDPRTSSWSISPARPEEQSAAFELAFAHLSTQERQQRVLNVLAMVAAGEINAAGIFVARKDGRCQGVFVGIPMDGATSLVWSPRVAHDDCPVDALVQAGLDWLQNEGTKLAQAIVAPDDAASLQPLTKHGFLPAGPMHFYRHDLESLPEQPPLPGLHDIPFAKVPRTLFAATLEKTYEGTLDFPELSGQRTIDEVLDGYQSAVTFRPDRWHLALIHGQPAGVLLLSELETLGAWDLTYLGVVPEFRRRGLGRAMVAESLRLANEAGASHLEVAVDGRNLSALQLYRSLGFSKTGERLVSLFFFKS